MDGSPAPPVYGPVAAEHLKAPRNLGRLADADGVGQVDDAATETYLTVYVRLAGQPAGRALVEEARFRALGCGGCLVTGSMATELARGRAAEDVLSLDAAAVHAALEDGLPAAQRYCADLAVRALHAAVRAATARAD